MGLPIPMPDATTTTVRLVAIDDDPAGLELIADALSQDGLEILTCGDPEEGWTLVRRVHPDIVLLDLMMPRLSGMDLLERIVAWDPAVDVILLTGHYSTDSAVEAIRKGACDYLVKTIPVAELRTRVGGLVAAAHDRRRTAELESQLLDHYRFGGMVGRSGPMLEVFARIRRVAPHFRTALVTGPTGTGKELVAHALHALGPAAGGRLVVCNCSAVVETLFESELFGYVKGAFTGATQDHMGLFEYANGGTLFLDEIGDMPLVTQSKLLRVLQDQEIQRVGSPVPRKVDVRVIAATNRDLAAAIAEKTFRQDLYYRLSMVQIKLPRLADRREDLPLLVQHFLERFSGQYGKDVRGLSRRAQAVLLRYPWPGNVRELENVLGHACMMTDGDTIDVHDLPGEILERPAADSAPEPEELLPLAELNRRHAHYVLAKMGNNKVRTAEVLGISRATLYHLLEEPEDQARTVPAP